MAKKYNYARTIAHADGGTETFGVEAGDSFDEVRKVVNKGIHDRKLEKDYIPPMPPSNGPIITGTPITQNESNQDESNPVSNPVDGPENVNE